MSSDLDQWRKDNETLAQIGSELCHIETLVRVRLPLDLARHAVEAWEREEIGDHSIDSETQQERTLRHRAGSLALIGLGIRERGSWLDDEVEFTLDAWFIGHALDCADDHGLIDGPSDHTA